MSTAKYLGHHAEDEARMGLGAVMHAALMQDNGHMPYAHVVVVPAMGETESLVAALRTIPHQQTLGIVVINARADSPHWVHDNNTRARRLLDAAFGPAVARSPSQAAGTLYRAPFGALLVVDRAHAPYFLPPKQGVGMARKVGADLALRLIDDGVVRGPWIHMTDADVRLPRDYFAQAARAPSDAAALVYPFRHHARDCPALAEAMQLYDISLRYYVLGLRAAGSPYAFHTIGSTIAAHATSYAAVRGMPLRDAAEDFYFLDKLRKVGPVHNLCGGAIDIDGRVSQRVPFGTGKALWRLSTDESDAPFLLYDPRVFDAVRQARAVLHQGALPNTKRHVYALLDALNAGKACRQAAQNTRSEAARIRYIDTWFDAFRTLKFVHLAREQYFASLPWRQSLTRAAFVPNEISRCDAHQVMNMMAVLDEEVARFAHEPVVRRDLPAWMRLSAAPAGASYAAETSPALAP